VIPWHVISCSGAVVFELRTAISALFYIILCGMVVGWLDCWSRVMEPGLFHFHIMTLVKLFTHVPLSPSSIICYWSSWWCSAAAKVTVVESNGCLPQGSWLSHMLTVCLETKIATFWLKRVTIRRLHSSGTAAKLLAVQK